MKGTLSLGTIASSYSGVRSIPNSFNFWGSWLLWRFKFYEAAAAFETILCSFPYRFVPGTQKRKTLLSSVSFVPPLKIDLQNKTEKLFRAAFEKSDEERSRPMGTKREPQNSKARSSTLSLRLHALQRTLEAANSISGWCVFKWQRHHDYWASYQDNFSSQNLLLWGERYAIIVHITKCISMLHLLHTWWLNLWIALAKVPRFTTPNIVSTNCLRFCGPPLRSAHHTKSRSGSENFPAGKFEKSLSDCFILNFPSWVVQAASLFNKRICWWGQWPLF